MESGPVSDVGEDPKSKRFALDLPDPPEPPVFPWERSSEEKAPVKEKPQKKRKQVRKATKGRKKKRSE